jgi:hypothetical protein
VIGEPDGVMKTADGPYMEIMSLALFNAVIRGGGINLLRWEPVVFGDDGVIRPYSIPFARPGES